MAAQKKDQWSADGEWQQLLAMIDKYRSPLLYLHLGENELRAEIEVRGKTIPLAEFQGVQAQELMQVAIRRSGLPADIKPGILYSGPSRLARYQGQPLEVTVDYFCGQGKTELYLHSSFSRSLGRMLSPLAAVTVGLVGLFAVATTLLLISQETAALAHLAIATGVGLLVGWAAANLLVRR